MAALIALVGGSLAGCTPAGGPILANPTVPPPSIAAETPPPLAVADPLPIEFPRDDGSHDRLTEWWYYTGHLSGTSLAGESRDVGFEYVIFRAERGSFPVTWASHLAVTDETAGTFHYAQRLEVGPQVERSPTAGGADGPTLDLAISGIDPSDPGTYRRQPWTMTIAGDRHDLGAAVQAAETDTLGGLDDLGLTLALEATKPAALHDEDGYVDFGAAGGSYYTSRTAMTADGLLGIDGESWVVDGIAWFDHQWGDFISVGGGGWDWFAVNLDDGTDLTISLVRDADGTYPLVYGTLVDAAGATRHLPREAFTVEVTDRWVSPATGADYPAGWTITIPGDGLTIELEPTVAAQELDTRATTGVIYWEGSQRVRATRDGRPLGGDAYVELTGYAAATAATRQGVGGSG